MEGQRKSATRHVPIESWIDATAAQLASLTLSIPLDDPTPPRHLAWKPSGPAPAARQKVHTVYSQRRPIERDSQERREALLKGKEGSRRRQRWENDRLMHVPGAVPPSAGDYTMPGWEPREEYRPFPYFLAPLGDRL